MGKNLVFIGAHNDDAEIFCGGTLLHHQKLGFKIHIAILDHSHSHRKKEQEDTDLMSGFSTQYYSTIEELSAILEEIKPQLVITLWNNDRHPDHRLVSQMTRTALKPLRINHGLPIRLFYCTSYDNLGANNEEFSPSDYIDTTPYWEAKSKLINMFTSQTPEYRLHKAKVSNQLYGSRVKTEYAEGLKEVFYLGKIEPIDSLLKKGDE